jgi:hypothetical protein
MGESERGIMVERVAVTFWCQGGHQTLMRFAATAEIPELWDCHDCGSPAGLDAENPPPAVVTAPFKSHLAYVRDRRSDAEAEVLLEEALAKLRGTA